MMRVAGWFGWLMLPMLAACQGDPGTARASLLAADQAFASQSASQGFAAAFQHYAQEDVVFLPDNGAAFQGKAIIERTLAAVPAGATFTWTPQDGRAGISMGYTWGVYELSGKDAAGQRTVAYGKYLAAWKRYNGDWRVQALMLNQSPGPAG
jgi:ketosteroid isomerase-like protein